MTPRTALPAATWLLLVALLALAALYVAWFGRQPGPWAELAVFALPPALLAVALWRRRDVRRTAFWAGVLALAWFSHGIMVAWTRPGERGFALVEVALALVVVMAASLPGLRARFARKRS